jgi:hypothetical protein
MAQTERVKRAVVLFTGNPRVEERRKRLPSRFLSTLHRRLRATVGRIGDVDLGVASEAPHGFRVELGGMTRRLSSGDLAGRVALAFEAAFDAGYDSVLVLAGDILGLRRDVIERSFEALEERDGTCVLGPSGDGGFYLVGLRRGTPFDWSSIPWCSAEASLAFCASAVEAGLVVRVVERLDDVDSLDDAVRLTEALRPSFLQLQRELRSLLRHRLHAAPRRPRARRRDRTASRALRAPPAA